MNQYPLWKYLTIVVLVVWGALYAMPNLYGNVPVVEISAANSQVLVSSVTEQTVTATLQQYNIPYGSHSREQDKLVVRFATTEDQIKAKDVLRDALGRDYIVALNLAPTTPQWLRDLNAEPMFLGLDLRGGVHFLMEVDMDKAIETALKRYYGDFRTTLRENKIRGVIITQKADGLRLKFRSEEDRSKGLEVLEDAYREMELDEVDDGFVIKAWLSETQVREIKSFALKQNITTLRNRVNEIGVSEPIVQQQGENRIVIQLPGIQDPAQAKIILGATATLEFRTVDENNDAFTAQSTGRVPPVSELLYTREGRPVLLKKRVLLTGDYITDAQSGIDSQSGGPMVSITLDGKGAYKFSRATADLVGKSLAVVFIESKTNTEMVNGVAKKRTETTEEVISVAVIREQLGKRFQITGLDSTDEARTLALLLRAGALAAPVEIIEERTIGPSLGQDNVDQGFQSVLIGFVLVLVFMVVWYRAFGLVANVALTLNLVLIVAVLSLLQATLTLPGIAGIVLTVGMAVDANVLIFERIREEIRNGNTPQASISAGYDKALSTIADANITTLLASLVLFGFGTGPIKGFAITLSIGIITSMFTAIMVTRAVVNLTWGKRRLSKLSI
jgi:preprotein translocase subunit SecD